MRVILPTGWLKTGEVYSLTVRKFLPEALREDLSCAPCPASGGPTILGVPWPVDASLQSLHPASPGVLPTCVLYVYISLEFSLCVSSMSTFPSSHKAIRHCIIGPILTQLISGSQRSKPAKPSTEPPNWSRNSQSASQVRRTQGTFGSDSKRGPPLGGWFRETCPLWVGAAPRHVDRRIRKRCPSGPDSLLPPYPQPSWRETALRRSTTR